MRQYDAVALFSGGLDSILAARLVQEQGLVIKCLHFITPFFGKADQISRWEKLYGLEIEGVDIGEAFTQMLVTRPAYGFGSVINPCVDCKILMLQHARQIMEHVGASFIISGEVLGQRPMSQRRDTLNAIRRDADVRDVLLRPLCAQLMDPIQVELSGKVDRSRLLAISGRGRKDQMQLAERFGLTEIPTPAGGCRLAEQENARSYWPVLRFVPNVRAADFHRANTGRQYWSFTETPLWLCVGRDKNDNERLLVGSDATDLIFKVTDFPSPIAVGRQFPGHEWAPDAVEAAAAFAASFSSKAKRYAEESGEPVSVRVHSGTEGLDSPGYKVLVTPDRVTTRQWQEYTWPMTRDELRAEQKTRQQ